MYIREACVKLLYLSEPFPTFDMESLSMSLNVNALFFSSVWLVQLTGTSTPNPNKAIGANIFNLKFNKIHYQIPFTIITVPSISQHLHIKCILSMQNRGYGNHHIPNIIRNWNNQLQDIDQKLYDRLTQANKFWRKRPSQARHGGLTRVRAF